MRELMAPADLGESGASFWADCVTEYAQWRPDEVRILESACRVLDTLAAIDKALVGQPLTVAGSLGQLREHPLLSEARQQRGVFARLVKQIDLADSPQRTAMKATNRSDAGRTMARARWG